MADTATQVPGGHSLPDRCLPASYTGVEPGVCSNRKAALMHEVFYLGRLVAARYCPEGSYKDRY